MFFLKWEVQFSQKEGTCAENREPLFLRFGPIYTKRQCQLRVILFSLKTIESPQNGVPTHFQAAQLFAIRTESLESPRSYHSIDTEAWCEWALNLCTKFLFGRNKDNDRNLCCEVDTAIPIESYGIFALYGKETGPGVPCRKTPSVH